MCTQRRKNLISKTKGIAQIPFSNTQVLRIKIEYSRTIVNYLLLGLDTIGFVHAKLCKTLQ